MIAARYLFALLLPMAACSTPPSCPAPAQPGLLAQLYFGGNVTDADWDDFITRNVMAAFPEGFTALRAEGAWKGGSEHSHLLQIAVPDTANTQQRLDSLASAYRGRFAQQSVLRVIQPACIAF